jgi:hypothetical protein
LEPGSARAVIAEFDAIPGGEKAGTATTFYQSSFTAVCEMRNGKPEGSVLLSPEGSEFDHNPCYR